MKHLSQLTALAICILGAAATAHADPRRALDELTPDEAALLVDLEYGFLTDAMVGHHMHFDHTNPVPFFTQHREFVREMESWLADNGWDEGLPAWDPGTSIREELFAVRPFDSGAQRMTLENPSPNLPMPPRFRYPAVCQYLTLEALGNAVLPWHNSVHTRVGGAMRYVAQSPAAYIFWPWHALIDDIYTDWELCGF